MDDAIIDAFAEKVDGLLADLRRRLDDNRELRDSRVLAYAERAGMPVRYSYSVNDTARITGIDRNTLYAERDAGRLRFILPRGQERGGRIPVDEMDRWLKENTR